MTYDRMVTLKHVEQIGISDLRMTATDRSFDWAFFLFLRFHEGKIDVIFMPTTTLLERCT